MIYCLATSTSIHQLHIINQLPVDQWVWPTLSIAFHRYEAWTVWGFRNPAPLDMENLPLVSDWQTFIHRRWSLDFFHQQHWSPWPPRQSQLWITTTSAAEQAINSLSLHCPSVHLCPNQWLFVTQSSCHKIRGPNWCLLNRIISRRMGFHSFEIHLTHPWKMQPHACSTMSLCILFAVPLSCTLLCYSLDPRHSSLQTCHCIKTNTCCVSKCL